MEKDHELFREEDQALTVCLATDLRRWQTAVLQQNVFPHRQQTSVRLLQLLADSSITPFEL